MGCGMTSSAVREVRVERAAICCWCMPRLHASKARRSKFGSFAMACTAFVPRSRPRTCQKSNVKPADAGSWASLFYDVGSGKAGAARHRKRTNAQANPLLTAGKVMQIWRAKRS